MSELNFVTHNDKNIECSGTHLQGYIESKFEKLVLLFGEPIRGDGYKTDAEWEIEWNDGVISTIYNWKDGKNYCGDDGSDVEDITEWHVGGFDKNAVSYVELYLKGFYNV